MAVTDRQNRLLKTEDWTRIYQSFRNADFQSYDFDNLRRTMINYLRENYPEDFNDYIESSEYIALIDLIALLGQNISYRIDLNARENFIELAERRESVLRTARLLSYNPKRVIPGNGLLKITSISTTEEIIDSNNVNLSNQSILWNDSTNPNWNEQFKKVLNAALPVANIIGKPIRNELLQGIRTEQYRLNASNTNIPVYQFSKSVDGRSENFEVVSTSFNTNGIYEESPNPGNKLSFLYRDNGQGPGSANTGYFMHFRQGSLQNNEFSFNSSVPHSKVDINVPNINNSDVWLYKLDADGNETDEWIKVDAVEGNNIVYNSIENNVRDIFSVLTRTEDTISLMFSDGIFGNLPKGNFRVYFRQSANRRYKIAPKDLRGITINIPYVSKANKTEKLSITLGLQSVVDNATTSETNDSIKTNAPSNYYTQNRLITGEDYNVGPLSVSQEIVKTKSVNRTSSGVSRYFDLRDTTGKYSNTNLYGNDGILYREFTNNKILFEFNSETDIEFFARNTITNIVNSSKVRNFYYTKFPRNTSVTNLAVRWQKETFDTNRCTGLFKDEDALSVVLGSYTSGLMSYIKTGAFLKFNAPSGYYYDSKDGYKLVEGDATGVPNALTYKWTKVVSVLENGTTIDDTTGFGPVTLNDNIEDDSQLVEIIPVLKTELSNDTINEFIDQMFAQKRFGLRYDYTKNDWKIILDQDLNSTADFSISATGDLSGRNLDASWLLLFETNGETYTITTRGLQYIFSSADEIRFYFDKEDKIYDSKTQNIVKDKIQVLGINTKPGQTSNFNIDFDWQIVNNYINLDGYIDSTKVELDFFDIDDDGIVDNPDIFEEITDTSLETYVFEKRFNLGDSEAFYYVDKSVEGINDSFAREELIGALSQYSEGTIFYFSYWDFFKKVTNGTLELIDDYRAFIGRDNIKFRYYHAANENRRLDPSVSNIIDTFVLTRTYDTDYRNYLTGATAEKPLPPSSDELFVLYGQELNKVKSISDEIVYHPVKYKPLFGAKAPENLQAKIKVVKNPEEVVNNNDIKSRVISAVNTFFSLENWDFGETFYFSELASYIMKELSPDLSSVILVPVQADQYFGSLYEVKAESDEIFASAATVNDIEIIDAITETKIRAEGKVVTSDTTGRANITSNTSSY
jgi:hypothetical protein